METVWIVLAAVGGLLVVLCFLAGIVLFVWGSLRARSIPSVQAAQDEDSALKALAALLKRSAEITFSGANHSAEERMMAHGVLLMTLAAVILVVEIGAFAGVAAAGV